MELIKDLCSAKNTSYQRIKQMISAQQNKPTTTSHMRDYSQCHLKKISQTETNPSIFSQAAASRIRNFSATRSFYHHGYKHNYEKSRSVKRAGVVSEKTEDSKNFSTLRGLLETTTLENLKLKKLNKELIMDKYNNKEVASTIHSFYQTIVLPENNESIEEMRKVIEELKERVTNLTAENARLRDDIRKRKSIIMRYRELIARNAPAHTVEPSAQPKASPRKLSSYANELNPSIVNIQSPKENVFLDMLCGALKKISSADNASRLIETLYQEIEVVLKVHKVGVFIVDPSLKKLFQKQGGKIQTVSLGKRKADLALHENTSHTIRPALIPVDLGGNFMRDSKTIVVPVAGLKSKLESGLYLMVQLENPAPQKDPKGGFTDEAWVLADW